MFPADQTIDQVSEKKEVQKKHKAWSLIVFVTDIFMRRWALPWPLDSYFGRSEFAAFVLEV